MNQSRHQLVRKYRQAIADHINEHPEHFVDTPTQDATTVDELRRRRFGRSGTATPSPAVTAPRPTGIELQWHKAGPSHHTLLRITPTNQKSYENDPRFRLVDEFGRRYATIGAGPDPLNFFGMFLNGKLKSDYNRSRDVEPHAPGIMIQPLSGMSEDQFINRLFKIDREYGDNLEYSIATHGPYVNRARQSVPPTYDSNSYISGLLQAVGVQPPALPVLAPGYGTRVRPDYFGR